MTSMAVAGGTRTASGIPGQAGTAAPCGMGQQPEAPGGSPPGLAPTRAAAPGQATNPPELGTETTKLLMMGLGAGSKLQVPKWLHVAQLLQ